MSKLVFFLSDIHFGIRNGSKEWLENQLKYFDEFFIPKVNGIISDEKVLIIAGDLFDNRQSLNVLIFNKVLDLFNQLQTVFSHIYIIAGNHDVYLKGSNHINSLKFLTLLDKVTIFEEPSVIKIFDNNFLMLPWIEDSIKEKEIVKNHKTVVDYVVTHTELKGFYYNPKVQVNKGHDISLYKGFKKVFSGHFHLCQHEDNFLYLGSPMQYDRNDIGSEKRFYYLDLETDELKNIINNVSPTFKKINIMMHLNDTFESFIDIIRDNYIDLVVPDNLIINYPFNSFLSKLKDVKKLEVKVIEETKLVERVVNKDNTYSILELADKYMVDNAFEDIEKNKIMLYLKELHDKINI